MAQPPKSGGCGHAVLTVDRRLVDGADLAQELDRATQVCEQREVDIRSLDASELREAQVRNFNRWRNAAPRFGGFQGEIDHLKDWLERRTTWIDAQLAGSP